MGEVIFDANSSKDSNGVAETSLEALRKKKENGTLETDRERCLYIIDEYGPVTSREMELHMGKVKHAFSGRIRELKDDGCVRVVGRRSGHQVLDTAENLDDGLKREEIDGVGEVFTGEELIE